VNSLMDSAVIIQTSSRSVPSPPSWFGEVVLLIEHLRKRCSLLRSPSWPGRERDRLPARSTLSRFLTALTQEPVEALRCLFLDDLLSRPLSNGWQTGDLVHPEGTARIVFDVDGTREAARQRALPQTEDLPPACATVG
jgi:hypothetical protein